MTTSKTKADPVKRAQTSTISSTVRSTARMSNRDTLLNNPTMTNICPSVPVMDSMANSLFLPETIKLVRGDDLKIFSCSIPIDSSCQDNRTIINVERESYKSIHEHVTVDRCTSDLSSKMAEDLSDDSLNEQCRTKNSLEQSKTMKIQSSTTM
jgi:hypothetical protein